MDKTNREFVIVLFDISEEDEEALATAVADLVFEGHEQGKYDALIIQRPMETPTELDEICKGEAPDE